MFSTNEGKHWPENVQIWTLFKHCPILTKIIHLSIKTFFENKVYFKHGFKNGHPNRWYTSGNTEKWRWFLRFYTKILNTSLERGFFSNQLKLSKMNPVFKEENKLSKSLIKMTGNCWGNCWLRWLRHNLRGVGNVKPFGSKILYMLVWTGRIKDNNLLLNIEIDSEFLILRSKLNQSFRVERKKDYLKQFVQHLKVGILLFLVLVFVSHFGAKFIK